MRKSQDKILKLREKAIVFIDWANVYNWKSSLKKEVDLKKLFIYLKSYKEIKEIRFYFGTDTHPASKQQLQEARKIGYKIVTKPVKYLPIKDKGIVVWKRKCDFDLEIGLDSFERLDDCKTFIYFSGDGDYATLYGRLIKREKQVIVVYMYGHLGKEVWLIKKGIFKISVKKLEEDLYKKMTPNRRSGA